MFILGMMNLVFKNKHLMLMLMGLEYFMILLIMMMGMLLNFSGFSYLFMVLMVMMVGESCLGMSLFIIYSRSYMMDHFSLSLMSKL